MSTLAHHHRRLVAFLAALLLAAALLPGCNTIRKYLGWGKTVESAEAGTPEAVIQNVIRAGLEEDQKKAWMDLLEQLHSQERTAAGSATTCRRTYWPAFRRKVRFLALDPSIPSFELIYTETSSDDLFMKVFVKSSAAEVPTPISVKRDPQAGNGWKLAHCSI